MRYVNKNTRTTISINQPNRIIFMLTSNAKKSIEMETSAAIRVIHNAVIKFEVSKLMGRTVLIFQGEQTYSLPLLQW